MDLSVIRSYVDQRISEAGEDAPCSLLAHELLALVEMAESVEGMEGQIEELEGERDNAQQTAYHAQQSAHRANQERASAMQRTQEANSARWLAEDDARRARRR